MGSVCRKGSSCCCGCSSNEHQSLRCPCKDVGLLRAWPVGSGGGTGYGSVSSEKHSQLLCWVRDWLRGGWHEKPTCELCFHGALLPCLCRVTASLAPALPAWLLLSCQEAQSDPPYPQWAVLGAGNVTLREIPSLLPSPPFLAQDTSLLSQPEWLCFGKLRT